MNFELINRTLRRDAFCRRPANGLRRSLSAPLPNRPRSVRVAASLSNRSTYSASMRPSWQIVCKASKQRSIAGIATSLRRKPISRQSGKSARQWLAERQQELDERAELVASREQEMIEREAAAEARSKELTKVREESLAEREQRLQCQLAELEDEKRNIQDRLACLDEDRAAWDERNERLQARASRPSKGDIARSTSGRRSCIATSSR